MKTSQVTLLVVMLLITTFLTFCVTEYRHIRPYQKGYVIEKSEIDNPETQDMFFGKVVGFYETLIYFQFGIIAVLLVLCFLYTHAISHRQAAEIVDAEMRSDDFKYKIELIGKSIITELFNNSPELFEQSNEIEAINRKIKNISTQISKIKKTMTELANDINNKPSKIQNMKEVADGNDS